MVKSRTFEITRSIEGRFSRASNRCPQFENSCILSPRFMNLSSTVARGPPNPAFCIQRAGCRNQTSTVVRKPPNPAFCIRRAGCRMQTSTVAQGPPNPAFCIRRAGCRMQNSTDLRILHSESCSPQPFTAQRRCNLTELRYRLERGHLTLQVS